jgi:hypothetical protein
MSFKAEPPSKQPSNMSTASSIFDDVLQTPRIFLDSARGAITGLVDTVSDALKPDENKKGDGWLGGLLPFGNEEPEIVLDISGPTDFQHGLHVTVDPSTGMVKGLPQEWAQVTTGASLAETRDSRELPDVLRPSRSKTYSEGNLPEISTPTNFKHITHVEVDKDSESGFKGLPPQWAAILSANKITMTDMRQNPNAVMDVIDFEMAGRIKHPPPREKDVQESLQEVRDTLRSDDPSPLFKNLVKIGEGGCGSVYYAEQTKEGNRVAIKVIHRSKNANMKAVMNEIALMRLSSNHPNVVRYYETFLTQAEMWIVMEYVPGGSLMQCLVHNKFNESQIAYVCRETLKALQFLHNSHRIHRDIKSDNFLMTMEGDIKLADFGYGGRVALFGWAWREIYFFFNFFQFFLVLFNCLIIFLQFCRTTDRGGTKSSICCWHAM